MRRWIGLAWLTYVLLAGMAQAELYRYIDGAGGVVLNRHGVPAELIGNGYEVLNEQGRLLRVVPPAPTPAERGRLQALEQRAVLDAQLLRLYSSVEDVERARSRKLNELDGLIVITDAKLEMSLAQRQRLEKELALQQDGAPVNAELLAHLDRLGSDQAALQQQLERYREARAQAEAGFARDRVRLAELLEVRR